MGFPLAVHLVAIYVGPAFLGHSWDSVLAGCFVADRLLIGMQNPQSAADVLQISKRRRAQDKTNRIPTWAQKGTFGISLILAGVFLRRPKTILKVCVLYVIYNVLCKVCSEITGFCMVLCNLIEFKNCSCIIFLQTAADVCKYFRNSEF